MRALKNFSSMVFSHLHSLSFFFILWRIILEVRMDRILILFLIFWLLEKKKFPRGDSPVSSIEKAPSHHISWSTSTTTNLLTAQRKLISGKIWGGEQFGFLFTLKNLFLLVLIFNLSGLNIFLNQGFIGKISLSLIIMALGFWGISYSPFLFKRKEKFSLFIIGEMKFPRLSFLLSNIEILTHLFRPITLTARLWVNIWVGHLLMRVLSTFILQVILSARIQRSLAGIFMLGGFFLFEIGIMMLQAFVFRYLVGVYWEENFHHSEKQF